MDFELVDARFQSTAPPFLLVRSRHVESLIDRRAIGLENLTRELLDQASLERRDQLLEILRRREAAARLKLGQGRTEAIPGIVDLLRYRSGSEEHHVHSDPQRLEPGDDKVLDGQPG